jgi:hypothetical protein
VNVQNFVNERERMKCDFRINTFSWKMGTEGFKRDFTNLESFENIGILEKTRSTPFFSEDPTAIGKKSTLENKSDKHDKEKQKVAKTRKSVEPHETKPAKEKYVSVKLDFLMLPQMISFKSKRRSFGETDKKIYSNDERVAVPRLRKNNLIPKKARIQTAHANNRNREEIT